MAAQVIRIDDDSPDGWAGRVSSLARAIGVAQSNLSEMLNGKRGWSKTAIRGLSAYLNIRAERFLS